MKPLVRKTYFPSKAVALSGAQKSGDVGKLKANDGKTLDWGSNGGAADFYVRATMSSGERASLATLTFSYDGRVGTTGLALEVFAYDFANAAWVRIFGPESNVTIDRSVTFAAPTATNYASAGGEMRLRVRGPGAGSFRSRTDLVSFTIEY